MYHNSMSLDCDIDKVNVFNNYFYSVFNKDPTDFPPLDFKNSGSHCHIDITEADVYDVLVGPS